MSPDCSDPPLVSVIIPSLGTDPSTAICSVLGQSATNTQILAVHDGSTAPAPAAQAYAARHPGRVVAMQAVRPGLAAALNCALERATGRYVLFMEGHEALSHDCLALFAKQTRRKESDLCKLVYSPVNPLLAGMVTLDTVNQALMSMGGT